MTYADMITLLLCFFAIFLSITIPKKAVPQKVEIAQVMPLPVRRAQVRLTQPPNRRRSRH
jgi:flagellar motor protein MotB